MYAFEGMYLVLDVFYGFLPVVCFIRNWSSYSAVYSTYFFIIIYLSSETWLSPTGAVEA